MRRLFVAAVLILSTAASAAEPSAEAVWAELQPLLKYELPDAYSSWTRRQRLEWGERRLLRLREQGEAFLAAHPTDPRRWSVAWAMINQSPAFFTSYGANIESDFNDAVRDSAAATAWKARLAALERELRAAPDLPTDVREALDVRDVQKANAPLFAAASKNETVDWDGAIQRVLDLVAKYPESEATFGAVRGLMYSYEMAHVPADSLGQWRRFAASPHAKVAESAREKVTALSAISGTVELAFTALDGREVATQKLRGKVVLINFWATWCGPCMAEKPNVKRVYSAYHERGFEIIGVSCDIAPENASRGSARIARTASQVLEFCRENEMPWPQHYEGRRHNDGGNTLAARFAVTGIPANFLLDQSGRVVAMNLRGDRLEAEVKRLLGL
ncbi:MAG TPA: TlpA disulfide reductase family protein [Opitutaceae bacterium]|nr:TlpA disulfide reductase family protein [Opitutaceae bacterium]HRJ46754.1 TlpA disulfide reductase family protein [Opitutaceae bacterium]